MDKKRALQSRITVFVGGCRRLRRYARQRFVLIGDTRRIFILRTPLRVLPWAVFCFAAFLAPVQAHGPLFMGHYESPGKSALDLHSSFQMGEGHHGSENAAQQGIGFGLSRNWAFEIEAPVLRGRKFDVEEISLGVTWRALNFDRPGSKRALVLNVHNGFSSRRDPATREIDLHHDVTGGAGVVVEKLRTTFIMDVSLQHAAAPAAAEGESSAMDVHAPSAFPSAGHGSAAAAETGGREHDVWTSAAYGYRFLHLERTRTDAMFFLELDTRLSRPRAQYLSPQLLFQPNQRLLLKAGYRFPLIHENHEENEPEAPNENVWAFQVEIRL